MPVSPPPDTNPADLERPLQPEPRPRRVRFEIQCRPALLEGEAAPTTLKTATITITSRDFPSPTAWQRLIRDVRREWDYPVLFGPKRRRQDELLEAILAKHGERPPRGHQLMKYWGRVFLDAEAACAREGVKGWGSLRAVRQFVVRREQAFTQAMKELEAAMKAHEEERRRRGDRFVPLELEVIAAARRRSTRLRRKRAKRT